MSELIWTPKLSVGHARLDEDHKGLITLINRLASKLDGEEDHRERVADPAEELEIKSIFNALIRYTEIHFAREERILKALDYPQLKPHLLGHDGFIRDIEAMRGKFTHAHGNARKALVDYLKDWLRFHIQIEDQAYRPLLEEFPEQAEAADCFEAFDLWESRHEQPQG